MQAKKPLTARQIVVAVGQVVAFLLVSATFFTSVQGCEAQLTFSAMWPEPQHIRFMGPVEYVRMVEAHEGHSLGMKVYASMTYPGALVGRFFHNLTVKK